jgi:hypothetical protein
MTKAAELAKMGEVLTNSQIGGRRNIIINGGMICSERATSATGLGDGTVGYKALDRFRLQKAGSPNARYTMTQDSNTPSGFANSMKLEVTTATTSFASSDHQYIDQFIEAQNLQQLAYGTSSAERITLSFYVKCSTAQTFALDLKNEDNTRYFNTTYTVSSADTWERKIITFPGDTASGFNNDNGRGLRVRWTLVAGSDLTDGSVSTSWSSTEDVATNHENTWVSATGRTWQLTGVQLEVGDQATPFEHRSFGEELNLCRRYLYKPDLAGDRMVSMLLRPDNKRQFQHFFPVQMRADPTSTITYDADGSSASLSSVTVSKEQFRTRTDALSTTTQDPRLTAFSMDAEL